MNPFPEFKPQPVFEDYVRYETRRQFFRRGASLLGTAALAALAPNLLFAEDKKSAAAGDAKKMLRAIGPHFPPKAKRVIYLHMVGGPSQLDLYDYKPKLGDVPFRFFYSTMLGIELFLWGLGHGERGIQAYTPKLLEQTPAGISVTPLAIKMGRVSYL